MLVLWPLCLVILKIKKGIDINTVNRTGGDRLCQLQLNLQHRASRGSVIQTTQTCSLKPIAPNLLKYPDLIRLCPINTLNRTGGTGSVRPGQRDAKEQFYRNMLPQQVKVSTRCHIRRTFVQYVEDRLGHRIDKNHKDMLLQSIQSNTQKQVAQTLPWNCFRKEITHKKSIKIHFVILIVVNGCYLLLGSS